MPRPRLLAALLPVLIAGILIAGRGDAIGAVAALVGGAIALVVAARRPSAPVPSPVDAPLLPPPPASEPPSPQQALDAVDAVLDALAEPVLVVERGRVLVANEAALALLGRHVVGQDVRLAIRHPEAAAVLGPDESSRSGEPILLDGLGALDQLWAMRLLATVDGRRVIHLSDRSAGRAADRMRTDFVANASHELRTPLASILGYVETLQGEAGEEAPLRARFLGVVQGEAARMQRLVQDLLSLSRIEADRFRLPAQRIDLDALVAQVAREFAGAGHAAELRVEVAAPLPPVIGDAPQLSQLLHNLIGNALAYGRPGAAVTLSGGREEGGVRLSVADQGEGIAAEHLPRLTERFYRVDGARSRAAAGTGLGLAIVKHIVERHRGRLSIDSVIGTGTTVTVRLPVVGPTVTEA